MKIKIDNYTFNKTAKTVTFTDYTTIRLDSVLIITNVESNIMIYNFVDPGAGGSVVNNVLTLDYNTTAMNDSDKLQIFYDDEYKASTRENQDLQITLLNTLSSLVITLNELSSRLNVLSGMANSGAPALRVVPIASVSTAVTGTVTANTVQSKEVLDDLNNFTAIVANINNVIITS